MLLDTAVGTIIRYRTILSYLCFDKQGASCARAPATRLRSRRAAIDQRATAVVPVFRLHHAVHLDGPVVVADHNCASVRAADGRDRPHAVPRAVDERGSRPRSLDCAIRKV